MKGNSRFIDRKYFTLKDDIAEGSIEVIYIPTNDQTADALTKALVGGRFYNFRQRVIGGEENV